jgi:hypothetical protein
MPSHTFTTTAAELLSETDTTAYAAVCVVWRPSNSASFQFDTYPPSSNAEGGGGITIGPSNVPSFFIPVPGVRLSGLYAAGAIGDVVDLICFGQKLIATGAA